MICKSRKSQHKDLGVYNLTYEIHPLGIYEYLRIFPIINLFVQLIDEKFIVRFELENFTKDVLTSLAMIFFFLSGNPCQIRH